MQKGLAFGDHCEIGKATLGVIPILIEYGTKRRKKLTSIASKNIEILGSIHDALLLKELTIRITAR